MRSGQAVEPSLYIGDVPRHASGNGLTATTWASLQEVHAAAVAPLLRMLADAGIPAYAGPAGPSGASKVQDRRARHQLLLIWVEAHQAVRAQQVIGTARARAGS